MGLEIRNANTIENANCDGMWMNSGDLSLNLLFFTCYIPRKLRLRISEWEREGKAIYGWGIPFIYSAGPHVGESAFISILKHSWADGMEKFQVA